MAKDIIMPALGETMDEGTIVRWLTESGQPVTKGQVVAEVESNKAVFEVEAPATGVLSIITPPGTTVPILTVIGTVLLPGEAPPRPPETASQSTPSTPSGDRVGPAPPPAPHTPARLVISPRARRLAKEKGVDIEAITGSGPGGRIEERDVRAYIERQPRLSPLAKKIAAEAGVILPSEGLAPRARLRREDIEAATHQQAPGEGTTEYTHLTPLSTIRRVIAQRMTDSLHTSAQVTLMSDVDATDLVLLREQLKGYVEQRTGESLSYNVLFAKMAAIALHEYPYMNARLVGDMVHVSPVVNVGIAVDTERGLMVPVLRHVEAKDILTLTREAADLFARARDGRIGADDMAGGTFTITNLGMYTVDAFTPIINPPECAILGVGRIAPRPAVWQNQIAIRHMVVLSLTFDHRLVDGGPAGRFLQRLGELVEHPWVVLLDKSEEQAVQP